MYSTVLKLIYSGFKDIELFFRNRDRRICSEIPTILKYWIDIWNDNEIPIYFIPCSSINRAMENVNKGFHKYFKIIKSLENL